MRENDDPYRNPILAVGLFLPRPRPSPGADLPPGLYEYAREAVAQQAKLRGDEETRSENRVTDVSLQKLDNVRDVLVLSMGVPRILENVALVEM